MSSSKVVLEPASTSFSPLRPPPRSRTSGLYPLPMASSLLPQNKFPRPTLFISCSSSSSSLSSGSSSGDHSADEAPSCSSSTSLSVSQSTGARRPLPQVPCPSGSQPYSSVRTTLSSSSSSPASPSSAASLSSSRRPRRALPAIPPTVPTNHYLTAPSVQIPSRNVPAKASSSLAPPVPSSSTSSSTKPNSQLHAAAPHKDLSNARIVAPPRLYTSSTNAQASSSKHPPPKIQTECAPARLSTSSTNAQASSSKHPPPKIRTDNIVLPSSPPLPVPPEARRPVLRVQTLVHPDDPLSTIHRPAAPAILVEPPSRPHPQLRMRRSSLDSQTTRFTTLLTPDQSLSPLIAKRSRHRKSRKGSQSTITYNQVHSAGSSSTRSPTVGSSRSTRSKKAGGLTADADEDLEQLSPMEFKPGEHHDSGDEDWGTVIEDADDEQKSTIVTYRPPPAPLPNSALASPTADQVINRRLNKLRRKVGDTAMREFNVGVPSRPGTGPQHRSGGLGRVVASEGEDEDDSSDDDKPTGYKIEDEMIFANSEDLVEDDEDEALVEDEPEVPAVTTTPVRLMPKTPKGALPVLARHVGDLGFLVRSTRRSWSQSRENLPKTPPPYSLHICTCGRGNRCSGNCPSSSSAEKKNFGRGWFRAKGGKKWEEQDLNDVLNQLRKL